MTLWFEDLTPGYRFETATRALGEDEILAFAGQWDPQLFHLDPEAAAQTLYGGLIASGFHTLLTAFNLTLETGLWREASLGAAGFDYLNWRAPVRPGDRLSVRAEVVDSTPSRRHPDRGRTVIRYEVFNQEDVLVMDYQATHLLRRRPRA
ncbi:acyl dehydratase [Rhodosalinus halophilus]|uniref:Acyl dehydratase n=1 Tax=Rhodosalinus halophilus TaxID=2259333 RepID=A0A365U795_9RHOB|nr:MaoC family dehydratase [Rhodosalinus halophilus]RBI84293.1 acyl dehydratase [Rhodosalinus halophilus]